MCLYSFPRFFSTVMSTIAIFVSYIMVSISSIFGSNSVIEDTNHSSYYEPKLRQCPSLIGIIIIVIIIIIIIIINLIIIIIIIIIITLIIIIMIITITTTTIIIIIIKTEICACLSVCLPVCHVIGHALTSHAHILDSDRGIFLGSKGIKIKKVAELAITRVFVRRLSRGKYFCQGVCTFLTRYSTRVKRFVMIKIVQLMNFHFDQKYCLKPQVTEVAYVSFLPYRIH